MPQVAGGGFQIGPQRQDPWQDTAKNLIGAYQAFKTAKEMEKESMLAQKKLEWEKQQQQITSTFEIMDKVASKLDGGWAQLASDMPDSLYGYFQSAGVSPSMARTLVSEIKNTPPGLEEKISATLSQGLTSSYEKDEIGGARPQNTAKLAQSIQDLFAQFGAAREKAAAASQQAETPSAAPTAPAPATPPEPKVLPIPAVGTMSPAAQAATRPPGPIYNYVGGGFNRGAVSPSPVPPLTVEQRTEKLAGPSAPKLVKEKAKQTATKVDEARKEVAANPGSEDALKKLSSAADEEIKTKKLVFHGQRSKRIPDEVLEVLVNNADNILDRNSTLLAFGGIEAVLGKAGEEQKAVAAIIKNQEDLAKALNDQEKLKVDWYNAETNRSRANAYWEYLSRLGLGDKDSAAADEGKIFMEMAKGAIVDAKGADEINSSLLTLMKKDPRFNAWMNKNTELYAKANGLTTSQKQIMHRKPFLIFKFWANRKEYIPATVINEGLPPQVVVPSAKTGNVPAPVIVPPPAVEEGSADAMGDMLNRLGNNQRP